MAKLGTSKLGSTQFSTPSEFVAADTEVRDRADDLVKSAFPTGDGTTWDKVLNIVCHEFEREHTVIQSLIDQRFIETATARQLDMIGEQFGIERGTDERDEHYRARVKLEFPAHTTETTIADVLDITARLLDCDKRRITLVESFEIEPARFDIFIEEIVFQTAGIDVEELEVLLQRIKAAGVRVLTTVGEQFTYRSVGDFEDGTNDPEKGYGGLDEEGDPLPDTGAPYADEITEQFT